MQTTRLLFVGDDLNDVNCKMLQKHSSNGLMTIQWKLTHFVICSSSVKTSIMIENEQISNSSCEKLLGVFQKLLGVFKLIFQSRIDSLCKKASQKLTAIYRRTPCINFS